MPFSAKMQRDANTPGIARADAAIAARICAFAVVVGGSLAFASTATAAAFEALVVSDAGDYVGGGQTYDVTSSGGTVSERAVTGGVQIQWQNLPATWLFNFGGPNGAPLQVGSYSGAQRLGTSFQQPGHPGMDIGGLGRGCNQLSGSFTVRDVAYDATGLLTRLAVDGTQYCETSARALHVYLRYGTTAVPLLVPQTTAKPGLDQQVAPGVTATLDGSQSVAQDGGALSYAWSQIYGPGVHLIGATTARPSFTAPIPSAEWLALAFQLTVTDSEGTTSTATVDVVVSSNQPHSEIRIVSTAGDPVGQGVVLDEAVSATKLTLGRNAYNGIDLNYVFAGATPETLQLHAAAPADAAVALGRYPLAYRYPFFAPSGKAGLDATLALGCSQSVSRFIVEDIGYDTSGNVTRLALDFAQSCLDVAGSTPLLGYIRLNSVVPITSRTPTAWAGASVLTSPGQSVTLDAGASTGGATAVTAYAWQQLSGPPIALIGATTSAAAFTTPAVPTLGSTFVFQVTVTNAAGYSDTDQVQVHVQGSAEPESFIALNPQGYDFITLGQAAYLDVNLGAFTINETTDTSGRDHVTLTFNDIDLWSLDVSSNQGQMLAPGVYPAVDTAGNQAAVSLSGGGRGCDETVGSLTIDDIERDASSSITSLALEFTTRCDHGAPTHGIVRYMSAVPVPAPTALASAGPPQVATGGDVVTLNAGQSYGGPSGIVSYAWQQIAGPGVTLAVSSGVNAAFVAPAAGGTLQFQVTVTTADGHTATSVVTVTVQPSGTARTALVLESDPGMTMTFGQSLVLADSLSPTMVSIAGNGLNVHLADAYDTELYLWAPFGQPFVVGTVYEGGRMFNGEDSHRLASFPGLDFEFDSFFCTAAWGRFVVRELTTDASGVTALAVDFQQTCVPYNGYVRGWLRVNSTVPVGNGFPLASAGPDLTVQAGTAIDVDGRASSAGPATQSSYQWQQLSGPPIQMTGTTAPLLHVTAPALATGTADAVLALKVADAQGKTSTAQMTLHILANNAPSTRIVVAHYQVDGTNVANYAYDANDTYVNLGTSSPGALRLALEGPVSLVSNFYLGSSAQIAPGIYSAYDPYQFTFNETRTYCSTASGGLRILQANYTSGTLGALAYDFNVRCGADLYAGSVRYQSAQSIQTGAVQINAGPDQTVTARDVVVLDGTRSLIVGVPIGTYQWSQISGPAVTLSAIASTPGVADFTAPLVTAPTALQFQLRIAALVGSANATQTVTVTVNPLQLPTVNLAATPTAVQIGQSVTVSWSSTNASTCTASGDPAFSGSVVLSGSVKITPATAGTLMLKLSCSGAGGVSNKTQSVTVSAAPAGPGGGKGGGGSFDLLALVGLGLIAFQRNVSRLG
jgi:hypothetical protein